MALNVGFIVAANPPSIPAQGGTTVVTFEASTDQGSSKLTADYSLDSGVPFQLVGPTQLQQSSVSETPRDYPQSLKLQKTGSGSAANVKVNVLVTEVGSGQTFNRSCRVTIAAAAAAVSFAAGGAASLGDRLRAHRDANDLTQQDVADKVGISRSHVSGIERGEADPSDEIRQKLEKMMKKK